MNDFNHIKKVYAPIMAELAKCEHWTDPYFVDWVRMFTPIESAMWGLIRCQRVPFYPQLPVGRYFVDFGNPKLKIAIECDGKDFHDAARDRKRDNELLDMGWSTVRFTGKECMNLDELPSLADLQGPFNTLCKRDWLEWQEMRMAEREEEFA